MALDACREMMIARAARGACTLVTKKKTTTDIKAATKVANTVAHLNSDDMPLSPENIQPSDLTGGKLHAVLTAFKQAAEELRLSIRFVWVEWNLAGNSFYADDIGSNTACVLVLWRPNGFKPLSRATGMLDNLMYELAPKPAAGFEDINDIYNVRK